ncbi:MAG: hypothetical protein FWF75_07480 [Propionibacteriaceae bacterium]|nr:hypothetical protein [Propionibacteriaceae bacterium]
MAVVTLTELNQHPSRVAKLPTLGLSLDDAIALSHPLGAADAIHVATAMRLSSLPLPPATHDAQMARVAEATGLFPVVDPVTDDQALASDLISASRSRVWRRGSGSDRC